MELLKVTEVDGLMKAEKFILDPGQYELKLIMSPISVCQEDWLVLSDTDEVIGQSFEKWRNNRNIPTFVELCSVAK
jgi:hypothetical protein